MTAPLIRTGLYRTTLALPSHPEVVPAGRLVMMYMTDQHPNPIVAMPTGVKDNRWEFPLRGIPVTDETWLGALVALPNQGFYTVSSPLVLGSGTELPVNLLVQLAFTQDGRAMLFPAQLMPGNRIQMTERGVLLSDLQLDSLAPTSFRLMAPVETAAAPAEPSK
jgi:hypothetical protein